MNDTGVKVLVAHGDAADLAVLASVAAAHGFDLRVVDAVDLLDEIRRYAPDAVVVDVRPRGNDDGYAMCLAIKRDPATAGIPVILTGSANGPDARDRAFRVGCDDFLEKPIHRHLLAHRLRSFARLRRVWDDTALRRVREAVACGELDAGVADALERWLQEQAHEVES